MLKHKEQSALTKFDMANLTKEFNDLDTSDNDSPPLHTDYNAITKCGKCGARFEIFDTRLICENDECRMISEQSYDDVLKFSDAIPIIKGITVEQRRQIYKELEARNKNASLINILPLPKEIIDSTVDLFAQLKNCRPETRNKKRCQYLGSCIYLRCIAHGLMRTKKDIQFLCGLVDRNLTTTIGEIQMEMNLGSIKITSTYDIRDSNTNSICVKINIPDSEIEHIILDVRYILDILATYMLISSNFDSKIIRSYICCYSY